MVAFSLFESPFHSTRCTGSSNLLSRDVMCSSSSALLHIPEKQRIKAKTEQGKEAPAELQWRPQFQPLSAISEAFLLNPRRPNSSICFPNPLLSTHPKKISRKSAAEAALEMVPKLQRCNFFLEVYWDIRYGVFWFCWMIKKEDLGCNLFILILGSCSWRLFFSRWVSWVWFWGSSSRGDFCLDFCHFAVRVFLFFILK